MNAIRLSGASVTRVKAEIDRYFDTHTETQTKMHECDEQCSDKCEREEDVIGIRLFHPTQILIEDFIERILEAL